MPRVICVGSINMDIAVYATKLPKPGETILGSTMSTSPGGKGLNQAVAARRLGADVSFVGNVGRDVNGETLIAFIDGEGIDTSGIARLEGYRTGTAVILVDAESENAIVVVPGANMAWRQLEKDRVRPTKGDVVVAQFEIPDEIITGAFEAAKASGARTVLNAAPARAVPRDLVGSTDILVVNEIELAAVSGARFDPEDMAAVESVARGFAGDRIAVVCTLGKRGAIVVENGATKRLEGQAVDAIDTAGAGDCFIGAFTAALVNGEDLVSAAVFGNRAAAISVTRKGTAISMPFSSELKA